MFIGAATHFPLGFITGRSSGATAFSQPSSAACASRLAVMPVAFHSAISGPLSWTAGGALPAITSARNLASVLAVWPAIEVCSHLPPAAVNISPSLAMAAASEPLSHWCSILVLGSAKAAPAKSPRPATPAAIVTTPRIDMISSLFSLLLLQSQPSQLYHTTYQPTIRHPSPQSPRDWPRASAGRRRPATQGPTSRVKCARRAQ